MKTNQMPHKMVINVQYYVMSTELSNNSLIERCVANTSNVSESASLSPPKPPPRTTSCKPSDPQSDQNRNLKNSIQSDINSKKRTQTMDTIEEKNNPNSESIATKVPTFMRSLHSKQLFSRVKSRPKSDIFLTNNSIGFPVPISKSIRYSTIDFTVSLSP